MHPIQSDAICDCTGVLPLRHPVCSVAISSKLIFSGHHNGIISSYPISSLQENNELGIQEIAAHRGTVTAMVIVEQDNNEGLLISASADETIKAWSVSTGQWVMTFSGHVGTVECIVAQGTKLFSGGADGYVKQWDIHSGNCLASLRCHIGKVTGLALAQCPCPDEEEILEPPREGVVLTASDDGLAKVIHIDSLSIVCLLKCEGPVTSITYVHPHVLCGGTDGKIRGFNIHTALPTVLLQGHTDAISVLAVADSKWLMSSSDDGTVRLWSLHLWECVHTFAGHTRAVTALSVDSQRIVSGSYDHSIRLWDRFQTLSKLESREKEAQQISPPKPKKKKEEKPKRGRK